MFTNGGRVTTQLHPCNSFRTDEEMSYKSGKPNKKQELAEKVQEIQKRQQNWFKEREQHKKKETFVDSVKETSKSTAGRHRKDPQPSFSSKSVAKPVAGQSKDKFHTWLEAREKTERLKLEEDRDELCEADVLQVSSSRTPGYATPDPDWYPSADYPLHSNQHARIDGNDAAKSLMSHQDFDEMANKIVARVKNELDIPGKSYNNSSESYSKYRHSGDGRGSNGTQSRKTQDDDVQISSHYCPECGTLMLSPEYVPMILTPCAHSMCQSCCKGRSLCPQCACTILSKTCNIMLLQIIQNHHKTRERTSHQRQQYSSDNYKEKAKTKQQYYEEYENLQTRQEVLKIESKEIHGHMSKLANKVDQQKQQIYGIEREEKKVRDKIQSLKEKLVELETHKKSYDREIDEIEIERTREKNKLNMVQDTLSSIEIQMEKLQILLEER